jgi:hypothetical protein
MLGRFRRLDTELDGEPTLDNNSTAQPTGINSITINVPLILKVRDVMVF